MTASMVQEVVGAFRAVARRMGLAGREPEDAIRGRASQSREAVGPPTKPRLDLPVLGLAEFRALDLPKRQRLLPWLVEGGLSMVYGPRGIGKTHFGVSLGVALVTGQPFLKWEVETPVGVLVVDGEMPAEDLRERINSWLPGDPGATLQVLSHEVVFERIERDLNLGLPEWQKAIMRHLEEHPEVRLIILDNLSCLLPSVQEDKRDDWAQKVLPFLIAFRRRGIAVLLVHHSGKGGDQRGTSAREDALDTVIRLSELSDHDATQGAAFRVTFTKARGCYGDDLAEVEARIETSPDGSLTWSWKLAEQSNKERLLRLVADGVGSVKIAAEELELTPGTVSKLKAKLQKEGQLANGRKLALAA